MISESGEFKILVKLGLTDLQSKVYISLVRLQEADIKTIASDAEVDRANLYRTILRLQEIGIVEKVITTPVVYRAISLQDALEILLAQRNEEYQAVAEATSEVLKKVRQNDKQKKSEKPGSHFFMTPAGKGYEAHFMKVYSQVSTNFDGTVTALLLVRYLLSTNGITRMLLKKGAAIRVLSENFETNTKAKEALRIIDSLTKAGSFEVRFIQQIDEQYGIFDKKSILMSVTPKDEFRKMMTLHSDNPFLVSLFQKNFENSWRSSTVEPL